MELIDPLHNVMGDPRIGSYITIKEMPWIWNIVVKKGVQRKALYMLAARIKEHNEFHHVRVLLKRKTGGRYVYKTLLSQKQIAEETDDFIAIKIAKALQKQKSIYLVVKPTKHSEQ